MMQPRPPTPEEQAELLDYVVPPSVPDPSDAVRDILRAHVAIAIHNAAIAVFDHYSTDGPGYVGKVLVIVWPGAPEQHELFIWAPAEGGQTGHGQLTKVSCGR